MCVSKVSLSRCLSPPKGQWYIFDTVHLMEHASRSIKSIRQPSVVNEFSCRFCSISTYSRSILLYFAYYVNAPLYTSTVHSQFHALKHSVPFDVHFWKQQPKEKYFSDHKPEKRKRQHGYYRYFWILFSLIK